MPVERDLSTHFLVVVHTHGCGETTYPVIDRFGRFGDVEDKVLLTCDDALEDQPPGVQGLVEALEINFEPHKGEELIINRESPYVTY